MVVPKLTPRIVQEAPFATGSSYYVMEGRSRRSLRGFGIRVYHTKKEYVVRFRGRPHHIGWTDLLTLTAAREEARKLLLGLLRGKQLAFSRKSGIQRYPEPSRRRHLSSDEYRRLGEAIARARRECSLPESAISVIELLIYTGCRPGEILGLRWEWVDLPAKQIHLPKAKADRPGKRNRGRVIWLNEAAVEVLSRIDRDPGTPFVLVGTEPEKPLRSIRRAWMTLCREASIEGATPYTLRHSFVSEGPPRRRPPRGCLRSCRPQGRRDHGSRLPSPSRRCPAGSLGSSWTAPAAAHQRHDQRPNRSRAIVKRIVAPFAVTRSSQE